MRNLCLSAALEELGKAGIHEPVIAHGAKHPQLRWTTPRGELRILRDDGMLTVPEPRPAPVKQPSRIELLERRLAEVERRAQVLEDLVRSVTVGGARP